MAAGLVQDQDFLRPPQGLAEDLQPGVAEEVDGLLRVPHGHHPGPRLLQGPEEAPLEGARVLVLVHEDVGKALHHPGEGLGVAEEAEGEGLEVPRAQDLLGSAAVPGQGLREEAHKPLRPLQGPKRLGQGPPLVEAAEEGLKPRVLPQEVEEASRLLQEEGLGEELVHHGEVRVQGEEGGRVAQGLRHEAVDGAEDRPVDLPDRPAKARLLPGQGLHPLPRPGPKLLRRLAGEGDGGDAPQGHTPLHQGQKLLHQGMGLPRAR